MAIQTSSAVLKSYFETGDVPTAAQFGDLIDSTAYYDHSLEKLNLSGSGTGSIPYVSAKSINPYTGSSTINVSASLIPPYTPAGSGSNLGSQFKPWKALSAISANIDNLTKHTGSAAISVSGGLAPSVTNAFDLGTTTLKWKTLHVSGVNVDYVSSSLIPDQDDTRDLGSSGREWRDLYIDGTAYIDTLSTSTTFATISATTASLTIISSSRIDGVGGYGNIIISGGLLPGTTNVFDLGSAAKSWKDLHVGLATMGTSSIGVVSSSRIDGVGGYGNIIISGGLVPGTTNVFDLGTTVKKWKTLHVSGASIDFVSSSLIPDQDNLRDLGSSGREWKDLYVDGTAYIDTLSISTIPTVTITTASITVISSSRIDGVGGYGNIIISGGLVPGTTSTFDLGTTTKQWKMLHVSGVNIGAVSSSLIPDQDDLRDLGSNSLQWKDLYIDGTANIDTLSADTASIGRVTNLIPTLDGASFLGKPGFRFKHINVISSSIDFVSSSLNPHKTSTYDLGSSTLKWRSASIDHITASVIIVDKITANTTTFTATHTITGSNQFGSGSSNRHSFSGSISAITDITASGNISASGTITAATFDFSNSTILTNALISTSSIRSSGSGNVYLNNDGTISASSTISSSGTILGAELISKGHITASGNISSSGTISASAFITPGRIESYGKITSTDHIFTSDASGSVKLVSGGLYFTNSTTGVSADDSDYTVHGRRFTISNQLQATLPASQSSGIFTVQNHSVGDGSVIIGTFMGGAGGGSSILAQSASIHCFTTASMTTGFKFYIHNNKTTTIANDTIFTASFVVL